MFDRRAFVAGVAGLALGPSRVAAQATKKYRLGFLDDVSGRNVPWFAAFEGRLQNLGYVEGQNLAVEHRSAAGRTDRLVALAGELVRLQPDVIADLGGPEGARALRQATSTIPVVFSAIEWDPVTAGVVESLVRPGRNFTGISALAVEFAGKRLELLRELIPTATRIAVLWHTARASDQFRVVREAADALKLHIISLEVQVLPHDYQAAFARAVREGDNEITGFHVSDGDPTVNGILGAKKPHPFDGKWRVFYTQQHGDNVTWEIIPNRHVAIAVDGDEDDDDDHEQHSRRHHDRHDRHDRYARY